MLSFQRQSLEHLRAAFNTPLTHSPFCPPPLPGSQSTRAPDLTIRSRVLKLCTFLALSPPLTASILQQIDNMNPSPVTIWAFKDDRKSSEAGRPLYCVYRTHEEACDALLLFRSSPLLVLVPALELELLPLHNFKRILPSPSAAPGLSPASPYYMSSSTTPLLPPPPPSKLLATPTRPSFSFPDSRDISMRACASDPQLFSDISPRTSFPLSSNPPNAKTNFRVGDWICVSANCGVHNFSRNLACIGCGSFRPMNTSGPASYAHLGSVVHPPRFPSPRFTSLASPYADNGIQCAFPQRLLPSVSNQDPPKSAASSYPILTPSGKQLSTGGIVQNISRDPSAPCFMFWSYNEPLPDPGQIRPALSPTFQPPPILNTGNRGPIEHQPGDWICQKCNYLNWRRRKVCQTCYPYAEGNGDSISSAVQAERIALLANVLTTERTPTTTCSLPPSPTSTEFTGSHATYGLYPQNTTLSRSSSRSSLFPIPQGLEQPIYQTSSSGSFTTAPLLPSFLHDIVHSATSSPASSSSADFSSLEDYDDTESWIPFPRHADPLSRKSSSSLISCSIWKLDGEETKALSGHMVDEF